MALFRILISASLVILFNTNAWASLSNEYLYVSGFGKQQQEAQRDAKKQLALMLYSRVKVKEHSWEQQQGQQSQTYYRQEAHIQSLPVDVQDLQLMKKFDCNSQGCEYQFRVNRRQMTEKLVADLSSRYQLATIKLQGRGHHWRDLKRYFDAVSLLEKNRLSLNILAALDRKSFQTYKQKQNVLDAQRDAVAQHFSITFMSSYDPFAIQIHSLLSNSSLAQANGAITIYIRGQSRTGQQGSNYVAQQTLIFNVFDTDSPGVVVSHKVVSALGRSPVSTAVAKQLAQQKLLQQFTHQSIFSVLD